ncbi:MAG: hypothetical protein MI923_30670 [Phycisphaerales bacterium]|nr:hypothetical protein [Phycisphaerales bacterium]
MRYVQVPTTRPGGHDLRTLFHSIIGAGLILGLLPPRQAQPQPKQLQDSLAHKITVEQEVLENIQAQPIGNHTLKVLHLPQPFLRRAADRIIRSTYQERHHKVVWDRVGEDQEEAPDTREPQGLGKTQNRNIKVWPRRPSSKDLENGRPFAESRPPLRGFRVTFAKDGSTTSPFCWPDKSAPAMIRRAADMVAERLAKDGLLLTTAAAIETLGAVEMERDPALAIQRLAAVGLPLDLLPYFGFSKDGKDNDVRAVVGFIAGRLAKGATVSTLRSEMLSVPFHFVPSHPGFRVVSESGEHEIGTVRLQLTRGTYWRGPGAGGNLDLARQLIEKLPKASFLASIEEKHLEPFLSLSAHWPIQRMGQLMILPEPMAVSQWTQDNGKAGVIRTKKHLKIATMLPRYASRREDGSVFVPGESFLIESLESTGHTVVQSPLLFQGGNLLAVREPVSGDRILLIGEAEIYRNTALGLNRRQVLEAFRIEFAVDRCVVLPAVSFHLDFDLCVRALGEHGSPSGLVAFVNDGPAAAGIILSLGVDALERHAKLDATSAKKARKHLKEGQAVKFLEIIGGVLGRHLNRHGHFPYSFAKCFAVDAVDSPVGNFQRFLLAMDTLVCDSIRPHDRHAAAYLRSFGRREKDRRDLHRLLAELGWRVVKVPSLADGNRSINYVNGIHDRGSYLMPVYGGLYAPLDEAAASVFRREFGATVSVIPVFSGESQRRVGAVHCSAAVYPALSSFSN